VVRRGATRDRAVTDGYLTAWPTQWRAAWSFYREADPDAEAWVKDKALAILRGQASTVAAAIRRKATCLRLTPVERANADRCASYLLNKRDHLNYPIALQQGWPITTGVIEGACRHLVKDRMDITGARWGLAGAEAILKLPALRTNGDIPSHWRYHLTRERQRSTNPATSTGSSHKPPEIPRVEPHPIHFILSGRCAARSNWRWISENPKDQAEPPATPRSNPRRPTRRRPRTTSIGRGRTQTVAIRVRHTALPRLAAESGPPGDGVT